MRPEQHYLLWSHKSVAAGQLERSLEGRESIMQWYVLQTKTGEEQKLVLLIRKIVPGHLYNECFVVYQEQLWRRQGQNFVHVRRAFPGYVFITSDEPELLFLCLKQVPAMAKMIADGNYFFLPLEPGEAEFLGQIMNDGHVISLSYLSTDGHGDICQVSGPLAFCVSQIVRIRFGKRHVLVRLKLLGEEKTILLGIVLNEDICQELRYGKVEAPIQVPEEYMLAASEKAAKAKVPMLFPGDSIVVSHGVFEGMSGRIYRVKNNRAKIGIHLFGQDMTIDMPLNILAKCK